MSDYQELLDEVVDVAQRAARMALGYFRQPILIEMKDNMTPVTVADKKTEEFIRGELERRFPDFGILGEEFGEVSKPSPFVFTIDPIDGTRSFVRGIPLFGTLIGLLRQGRPILGVMDLPALNETYWAAQGTGTFCNGHQVHVSQASVLESSFVAVGDTSAFHDAGKSAYLKNLIDKTETARGYTDCFGHSLVLRGAVDAMVDPVVSIWDVAPIACLVEEAGGCYYTFEGNEDLKNRSFITSPKALKKDLLSL